MKQYFQNNQLNSISNLSHEEIMNLIGKRCLFISDCELFDNFNIKGIVSEISYHNSEYIIHVIEYRTGKKIQVGTNMSNLKYTIL